VRGYEALTVQARLHNFHGSGKQNKERNSSIARAEQDFSRFDSSQLAARTDAFDLRWRQVGNICVPASSTLGVGPEDIVPFKNKIISSDLGRRPSGFRRQRQASGTAVLLRNEQVLRE